ncbi:MAG: Rieske 2Fe-2S domain-containing protein [Myxococcales bacterium]|nr:Rieske 2Fe-2S domain-containing protein [Myxococcales bacterium]
MAFERVAGISDLPKHGGLRVEVGGREIGLWQVGGRVYAMENLCPHAGFPLHEGGLEGTFVVCAGHGWAFDLETGLAPGEVDEEPLCRWPVRVEGDDILIDPDLPL